MLSITSMSGCSLFPLQLVEPEKNIIFVRKQRSAPRSLYYQFDMVNLV
ncbi:Bgt-50234 [Blumeria graminis f. sp. tritici]|uniref:Bgt-50234 n=1 Tax=Blumeria graminis f. sp. tritici TaxID=62690 RepID=A0A9X9QGK5_BLUGR|nr:Bgt-50234 [Blumeria graminis f. sp. tritici]